MALDQNIQGLRIVGSNSPLDTEDISAVLNGPRGDVRYAVEHVLAQLNHMHHPKKPTDTYVDRYSPKRFVDTPKLALETLEVLLEKDQDVFSKIDIERLQKIITYLYLLLSEYYGNSERYDIHHKDPEAVSEIHQAQQRLTDIFHFLVGNIIDKSFEVSEQLGEIGGEYLIDSEEVRAKLEGLSEFPNIKKTLQLLTENIE